MVLNASFVMMWAFRVYENILHNLNKKSKLWLIFANFSSKTDNLNIQPHLYYNFLTMILLDFFQVYLPIILGCKYIFGQDKTKIQQLLKFQIIHCVIWFLQQLLSLLIQPTVLEYLLLIPYLNLTIYHYVYAADLYDLMVAPIVESVRDYVVLKAHKWSYKSKLLLDPDNLFLVKETKDQ